MANVGNHLHFQLKLSNRFTYTPFIRALTASIAMAVTKTSRWNPLKAEAKDRFWDRRPYTRAVKGITGYFKLRDYIEINKLEGFGFQKPQAPFFLAWNQIAAFEKSD